jgi:hypothetical protein
LCALLQVFHISYCLLDFFIVLFSGEFMVAMAEPITNPIARYFEHILGTAAYSSFTDWLSFYSQMYNLKFLTLITITAIRRLASGYRAHKEGCFSKKILFKDASDAFCRLLLVFSAYASPCLPQFVIAEQCFYALYAMLMLRSIFDNAGISTNDRSIISQLFGNIMGKKPVL